MFEDEVAMERRSSFAPLVLMVCLLALIVGTVGYVVFEIRSKTPLSAQQATPIVAAAVQGMGPAVIHFRVGLLKADDNPNEPNYRLLQKAGIVKLAKEKKGAVTVSLTPEGERQLSGLPGFKKEPKDGGFSCQAPLANRQLLGVAGVEMTEADHATVTYNWKWVPNSLGDAFDAGGPLVKSFNLWERQTLISKYQADFYHRDATTSTLTLVRQDREWKLPVR